MSDKEVNEQENKDVQEDPQVTHADKDAEGGSDHDGNPAPKDEPVIGEQSEDDNSSGEDVDNDPASEDNSGEDAEGEDASEDQETDGLDIDTWGTTGDEVGDSVLEMLQNSKMTPDEAKALLYDAVQQGDPSKIDRDALIEKVGKAQTNLIMAGIENFTSRKMAEAKVTVDAVHEVAGGKENWDQITPWAKENLDKGDLQDYAEMIDAGGAKARFAAAEMVKAYNNDPKNTTLSGNVTTLEGDTSVNSDSGEAITAREYAERLEKAHRAGDQAEINKIQLARKRGRAKGI